MKKTRKKKRKQQETISCLVYPPANLPSGGEIRIDETKDNQEIQQYKSS
jgi:hypothetical protein